MSPGNSVYSSGAKAAVEGITIEQITPTMDETLLETLEGLGDPELMETLRRSLHEIQRGQAIAWEEAERLLDL